MPVRIEKRDGHRAGRERAKAPLAPAAAVGEHFPIQLLKRAIHAAVRVDQRSLNLARFLKLVKIDVVRIEGDAGSLPRHYKVRRVAELFREGEPDLPLRIRQMLLDLLVMRLPIVLVQRDLRVAHGSAGFPREHPDIQGSRVLPRR